MRAGTVAWGVLRSMRPSAVHTARSVAQSVAAGSVTVTSPGPSGVTVSSQVLPTGDASDAVTSEPPVIVSASAIEPPVTWGSASSKLSLSVNCDDRSCVAGTPVNHAPGGASLRAGSASVAALSDTSTLLPAEADSTPSVGHQYVPRSTSPFGTWLSEAVNCWPSISSTKSVSSEARRPR